LPRLLFTCSSLIAASVLALTTTASAISPPTPWDGANPFHCTIQNAGFGPTGPKPVAHWANRIELLAMVEDTHDGTFYAPPPTGGAIRAGSGPIAIGTFNYAMSEQSVAIRQAANAAMRGIANHRGLGRFMALTETQGVYCAHPLGGCRMAESSDLGVVDAMGAVYGYEGLYCIDGSIVPTSLGVNPSLTISALSERCAERLVARGADFGLPRPPSHWRAAVPPQHIGKRVTPA
jgi:enediyne biosynthesis protein E9